MSVGFDGPRPAAPAGSGTQTSAGGGGPAVLLVDDDPVQLQLVRAMLAPDGYRLASASDGGAALRAVSEQAPDLILLDLHMPGKGGFEVLEAVQADVWMRRIPVVVVTASDQRADRLRALDLGAADFLGKPVDREELRARVRSLLRAKAHADDSEQAEQVLLALARAVEARDAGLRGHGEGLAQLALALGREMGLAHRDLATVRRGAFLHDLGQIGIPDAILLKPGPLEPKEWAVVRTHPVVGEQTLRPLRALDPVRDVVRHHHEHLDGSGYPDALRGDDIALAVRVLAVADVFDVLTRPRAYRPAFSTAESLGLLRAEAERGWWDPAVVAALRGLVG